MRTRVTRRSALWLVVATVVVAGSAYMASNLVPTTSASDTSLPATHTLTYDDHDYASLAYIGTWTHDTGVAGAYDTTLSVSGTATSSVSVTFTGTAVQWIGETGPTNGKADVWLDTTEVASNVSTSSATTRQEQVLYTTTGLTPGSHTLKIVVIGPEPVSVDAINVPQ